MKKDEAEAQLRKHFAWLWEEFNEHPLGKDFIKRDVEKIGAAKRAGLSDYVIARICEEERERFCWHAQAEGITPYRALMAEKMETVKCMTRREKLLFLLRGMWEVIIKG